MLTLTDAQVAELKFTHKKIKEKKVADRIKAILMLHNGFSYEQIREVLLLDEVTIRRYWKQFEEQGITGLLAYRYTGGVGKLTKTQEKELKRYLKRNTQQEAKEVVKYIEKIYQVHYSVIGVTKLLHRLGFSYKKPKVVPGKADAGKQEAFIENYEEIKGKLGTKDRIYFADATHPEHNTKPEYGWILKGKKHDKYVKTNSGRKRLNLNGIINLEEKTAIVLEEETINSEATIRLLEAVKKKQKHGKVYVILDNARYHHSKRVKNWLLHHSRFKLLYLPAYSPNLNIIERLWKYFHKKVTWNRYFKTFEEFKRKTLEFFNNLKNYQEDLRTLLTDNFQLFPTAKVANLC